MRFAVSVSAIIGENLRLKLFTGLAQPKADPSQPEADPSSGGLWRRLGLPARRAYSPEGAKNFVKVVLFNILFGESKIGDAR
jgi:hypothetical protein